MTNSHNFYSLDAPAGSGKTTALASYAVKLANNNQKVLISQPTKLLIQQTWQAIKRNDPSVPATPIFSKALRRANVLADVIEHIQNAKPGQGEVLLISQDILNKLPKAQRKDWHLFVDEMPAGFEPFHMSIPDTHSFLTAHLKAENQVIEDIVQIEAENVTALRNLAATNDDALKAYTDLVGAVLDEDRLVLASKSAFDNLVSGEKTEGAISFFSILQPTFVEGFDSVTVMGANLDESELYLLWDKLLNVSWKKHPVLTKELAYTTHGSGHRLTIKYLIKGNWSKDFAGKPLNGRTVFDELCATIENELGDDFLWQANVDVPDYQFGYGLRLPGKSHGLNRPAFMKCDNVALVMAVNHQKAASDFLKVVGFTQEELKIVLQYQNEYQAMMRSSLRDPTTTNDVTVVVVSEGSANWLAKRFPGCKVERIESEIPEPNTIGRVVKTDKESNAEKQRRYRENKKMRQAALTGKPYQPTKRRKPKAW